MLCFVVIFYFIFYVCLFLFSRGFQIVKENGVSYSYWNRMGSFVLSLLNLLALN